MALWKIISLVVPPSARNEAQEIESGKNWDMNEDVNELLEEDEEPTTQELLDLNPQEIQMNEEDEEEPGGK